MRLTELRQIIREEIQRELTEQANPELDRTVREFIRRLAAKYQYRESDAVMAIFEALKRLNMLNKSVEYMSPSGFGVEK